MPVVPDVSLGTHFFNDLVESNMLYLAVHPTRRGDFLNLGSSRRPGTALRNCSRRTRSGRGSCASSISRTRETDGFRT